MAHSISVDAHIDDMNTRLGLNGAECRGNQCDISHTQRVVSEAFTHRPLPSTICYGISDHQQSTTRLNLHGQDDLWSGGIQSSKIPVAPRLALVCPSSHTLDMRSRILITVLCTVVALLLATAAQADSAAVPRDPKYP